MVVLQAYQAKHQEKCAFSITENHLSGCGVGSDDDVGMSVSCLYRCDSHSRKESERRPVTHCQTVSEPIRSDGSCIQCNTFLYMRPLQWWLRTKGFSPRGNLFRMTKVTRRCLDSCLKARCWGLLFVGRSAQGLWEGNHLTWHINCLEKLAVFHALKHLLPVETGSEAW